MFNVELVQNRLALSIVKLLRRHITPHYYVTNLMFTYVLDGAGSKTVHEFHETCHSVTFHFMKNDSKRCCDTTTPESIHTKDESKRGSAFAFIFGVN